MSQVVPMKDFGIPVNAAIPTANHIVAYYGPANFKPAYDQAAKIDCGPISGLTVTTDTAGTKVWDISSISAKLPKGLSGNYDFYFTDEVALASGGLGNKSDFSPKITATVDTTIPPALGQPVLL